MAFWSNNCKNHRYTPLKCGIVICYSFFIDSSWFFLCIFQYISGIKRAKNTGSTLSAIHAHCGNLPLLSYRPSVFILPFLFILLYIALKEPIQWKLFPIVWLSIFIITISHTGTFIFLISFSILFFLLYCLFWGKFSLSMFIVILSSFIIYIFSLKWFPRSQTSMKLNPRYFYPREFS